MKPDFAGRLAEPFVLALLKTGPTHGYALLKSLEEAFGDGAIAKARVYQILRRLEEEGLVEGSDGRGNRKEYRLTPDGEAQLEAAADQAPPFYALLGTLFPALAAPGGALVPGAHEGPGLPTTAPTACPGCAGLRMRVDRTLDQASLRIDLDREGAAAAHAAGCPIGTALGRLLGALLP